MPDPPDEKYHPHPGAAGAPEPLDSTALLDHRLAAASLPPYAELQCLSNFSFLRAASHPEELVEQAVLLGYGALAITDLNSLAGIVRAHLAAREHKLHLLVGATITPVDGLPIVLLAPDRPAYARLCRLITRGRLRAKKGSCELYVADVVELAGGMVGIIAGCDEAAARPSDAGKDRGDGAKETAEPSRPSRLRADAASSVFEYRRTLGDDLYLAATLDAQTPDVRRLAELRERSLAWGLPLVACNDVHYHAPQRRYLQDVLTCIREKCTLTEAGSRLFSNAERHLRPRDQIARRYGAEHAEAVARTMQIARRCSFSLDELRYEYPQELCPQGMTRTEYLERSTWESYRSLTSDAEEPRASARAVLPKPDSGVAGKTVPRASPALGPAGLAARLKAELALIADLGYEAYFLTVWDLVRFARSRGILCQGRGSAANSAVCYCLGITAVDPQRVDLLFERFISRERNEPPDIDVDFEHERREEVFQYIYEKYGRERAAITAEVITYRRRSAVRDVGKALGFSLDQVDKLSKTLDWWFREELPEAELRAAGLNPHDRNVRLLVGLLKQILGFPRHLSQHVGGFVITQTPLCELVPLQNGAMEGRTFIEWDKDDIDALGILKVDCLSLGMLTALRKAFVMLSEQAAKPGGDATRDSPASSIPASPTPIEMLRSIPAEDPAVYDMLGRADSVGVFQVESRAQMSMLPRLKPRNYYDLVIEVSIVRPGPIQGGMVHPYLRRRAGHEPVVYPSEAVRGVLHKTLGVPLFQEQVMRLAVVAAGFTPGEADQLRRAMGAWRRTGNMEKLREKLLTGMHNNGYAPQFAEQIYNQIRGFGEYGFPESHAASFALLVYASAWLKRYHPAAFCGALLNSQPMGFYAPAQLIRDAQSHGVTVLPVDVNASGWECSLGDRDGASLQGDSLRLGMLMIRGLSEARATGILAERAARPIRSIRQLARRDDVSRDTLLRLAAADAFRSLGLNRRQALWQILALDDDSLPLFADYEPQEPAATLPQMSLAQTVQQDYEMIGVSLNAHPMSLVREELAAARVLTSDRLRQIPDGRRVRVGGLVTHRQRPGTARGIVFMTLEDECGSANLVVKPEIWERHRAVARTQNILMVEGSLQKQDGVIHVVVARMFSLTQLLAGLRQRSRDFR